ncbi:MAG TPA: NAD-dependent epimerase/dehydratase family protein, partial [Vicinamibacterales bacterium]|nr:NAD-dependent epimerase/dehydratase family protein [Vicinamibacterales bacterium]
MRVLITGGAGFIGSHLSDALLERGDEVFVLDNLSTGSIDNILHLKEHPKFHYKVDTVENEPLLAEMIDRCDVVVHFAAAVGVKLIVEQPVHTIETNVHGTEVVLKLANKKKKLVLIASTSEVYGDPLVHPQPEQYWGNVNPIGPRGVYDEAKRYAEALTMAYHRQQGVDTAIVRIFNTYGPRMRAFDGRAIPTFIRQAIADQSITVFGAGFIGSHLSDAL